MRKILSWRVLSQVIFTGVLAASTAPVLVPEAACAEVYIVRGRNGALTFTSRKPSGTTSYKTLRSKHPRFSSFARFRGAWSAKPVMSRFDVIIRQFAKELSIEPALVKAMVHVESAFNDRARSRAGAQGLMQLIPATATRFGVADAYHPEKNLRGGTKYFRWLLDRYSGNESLALAAYNAGEGAVDSYGGIPPYSETQTYVKRVLKMREVYRCVDTGRKNC